MSADLRAALGRHIPVNPALIDDDGCEYEGVTRCLACGHLWGEDGCDASRALAALDAAEQRASEALEDRDGIILSCQEKVHAAEAQHEADLALYRTLVEDHRAAEAQVAALVEAVRAAFRLPGFQSDTIRAIQAAIASNLSAAAAKRDARIAREAVEGYQRNLMDEAYIAAKQAAEECAHDYILADTGGGQFEYWCCAKCGKPRPEEPTDVD
jgi:hypothetical protein